MNHSSDVSLYREQLVKQLLTLGEEKEHFLDTYFSVYGNERIQMSQFLTSYTQFLEKLLTKPGEQQDSAVLIGSTVEITYLEYQTTDVFTIVLPGEADPDEDKISFLSPVGKQLLMTALNDVVTVSTPSGAMRVQITAITHAVPAGGNHLAY